MTISCIITGATDGIGKQTALELAKLGYNLGLVGRNEKKGISVVDEIKTVTGNGSVKYFNADLSIIENIKHLSNEIKNQYSTIDILINNAGAYFSKYQETEEKIEKTFVLNHLSYFVLTNQLIDLLESDKAGRVINVASGAHFRAELDVNDFQMLKKYKGWTAYCNSKLMNVLFTYAAHKKYKEKNISFNCLHPGFVDTRFGDENKGIGKSILSIGKKLMAINVKKGAKTSIYLAVSDEVANVSGKYFYKSKIAHSSKISHLESYQKKLWDYSEEIVQDFI